MEALLRRSNGRQNHATVEHLAVDPGDALLEIGFGPGDALALLARRQPRLLAGVDHSPLMVRRAGKRLAGRLPADRIDLRVADAAALPFSPGRFDVAFAVNSFHQWPDQAAALEQLRLVLRPGGRAVLSIRVLKRDGGFESRAAGEQATAAAERGLIRAGFDGVSRTDVDLGDRLAVLVEGLASA